MKSCKLLTSYYIKHTIEFFTIYFLPLVTSVCEINNRKLFCDFENNIVLEALLASTNAPFDKVVLQNMFEFKNQPYLFAKACTSLKTFELYDSKLAVPLSLRSLTCTDQGSSIREVIVANHKFPTIREKEIATLKSLVNFKMTSGPLVSVDKYVFSGSNLVVIDLAENYIDNVAPFAFSNMKYLQSLVLRFNNIDSLDVTTFHATYNIVVLDLRSNMLGTLPRSIFRPFKHLKSLDLKHNTFQTFSSDIFPRILIFRLESLDLSENSLTDVYLFRMNAIRSIIMTGNKIRLVTIHYELKQNMTFYISNNELSCDCFAKEFVLWYKSFVNTPYLESPTRLGNYIEANRTICTSPPKFVNQLLISQQEDPACIPVSAGNCQFLSDKKIRCWDVYFAEVTHFITMNVLSFHNSSVLELDAVLINVLDEALAIFICSFNEVIMTRNQINHINEGVMDCAQSLVALDLSRNSLPKLYKRTLMKNVRLVKLLLSYNRIDNIEQGSFDNSPNLTILDLSYNRIDRLDNNLFQPLVNLKDLYLNNNFLMSIDRIILPANILILKINFNELHSIPPGLLINGSNIRIDMEDNAYICRDDYIKVMQEYIKSKISNYTGATGPDTNIGSEGDTSWYLTYEDCKLKCDTDVGKARSFPILIQKYTNEAEECQKNDVEIIQGVTTMIPYEALLTVTVSPTSPPYTLMGITTPRRSWIVPIEDIDRSRQNEKDAKNVSQNASRSGKGAFLIIILVIFLIVLVTLSVYLYHRYRDSFSTAHTYVWKYFEYQPQYTYEHFYNFDADVFRPPSVLPGTVADIANQTFRDSKLTHNDDHGEATRQPVENDTRPSRSKPNGVGLNDKKNMVSPAPSSSNTISKDKGEYEETYETNTECSTVKSVRR